MATSEPTDGQYGGRPRVREISEQPVQKPAPEGATKKSIVAPPKYDPFPNNPHGEEPGSWE